MKISFRQLLSMFFFLMPFASGWNGASEINAQENKHAQAMHTAFIETLHGKFPKDIKAKWESMNEDSATVVRGQWGCLDGGGLVPKEKIHVVKLSDNSAAIGPLYIDGHRFAFSRIPDDPLLPLRPILEAFDKQSPYANNYYSYVAGDEQAIFPGVNIAWGEQGQSFPLELRPEMSTRIIGFKDDDGFRSTYLLSWIETELSDSDAGHKFYSLEGIIYEFHCPKLKSVQQIKSYDPDDYLNRTNTGLGVAHNLVRDLQKTNPERAALLMTDTLAEKYGYSFHNMVQKLYGRAETYNLMTGPDGLMAKVRRMVELSRTANPTEMEAICHTLVKEVNAYPFLLSNKHVREITELIDEIAEVVPGELKPQAISARTVIGSLKNQTADVDSLSEMEQEYLNRNFWKLIHQPVRYQGAASSRTYFASKGAHYSGDAHMTYFEVQHDELRNLQLETTLRDMSPGRYRLSAVVRADKAEHSGIYIFCESGGGIYRKEIPGDGDTGGNVWFSALCRFEQRAASKEGVYVMDINKATVNGGQGFGWSRIYIDDIIVRDGTLKFGVSTRPEITDSHTFGSRWFSACDFTIERVGDE